MIKFLKGIIGFSLKNKYLIITLGAVLILTGIYTFTQMPIEAFPDVTNTEIVVITQWPGQSAEEVEKLVTIPIEIALNPVQKKISLRSSTIFGLSYVKVIFDDNVKDAEARQQVMFLLNNANLPNGVSPSVQPPTGPTGEIFRYTLKSTFRDVRELKTIQDWVIDRRLRAIPGIADVNSFGGKTKTFEITVDPGRIATFGLTPLDVFTAIQKTNINVGGDMIVQNNQAFAVRGIGLLRDINQIRNIVISNNNGVPLLVSDVATVSISNLPRLGWVGRSTAVKDQYGKRKVHDEDDVVEAIIVMRKGENPSDVVKALKAEVKKLNDDVLPPDTKIVPYYDRSDLIGYATHTVLHNLIEGILLVTLLVSVFMFNWRTTLIVSIIIPMALLFAFICLHMMGMSANLLSLGAVDFGIIIDGAVVMVEGMFVILDHKAIELGMDRFNKIAKGGLIKNQGAQLGKAIFFAKLIIITGLLPIFAFQKVEGKLFSPLAYTLGFALLGALITTLTLVPVLISMLLKKNVHEKHNPFVHKLTSVMLFGFIKAFRYKKTVVTVALIAMVLGLLSFKFLGSEFLPELDEGSIWLRVQLPYSISLDKSVATARQVRKILMKYPQVKCVASQTGRPDNGTDVAGFYNNEFDVLMYPEEDWHPKVSKEELIAQMNKSLSVLPGAELNFSQPISDNVEEAVSGVKGSIVVKVYGDSLNYMEGKTHEVYNVLKKVKGITDLGVLKSIGLPELDITLDQQKMAQYGVSTSDANSVIAMAIGGEAASTLYEGIKTFDIRVRFPESFRQTPDQIGNLMVPTQSGSKVPIREVANITQKTGPCLIFRDGNERFATLKFSVRGRDMGSTIKEAQEKVKAAVTVKHGYRLAWQGDFENQQRAEKRLAQVVPISLALIFLLLFIMFGDFKDAALIFLNVPFAIVGGIMALFITGTNFSISAGIGFIALFGICIQDGVLLITIFKHNLEKFEGQQQSLYNAMKLGVNSRIRPVMMTALMAAIGLFPAAISHGIGSESSRPLARVVIGGILCAMLFSLWVFPLIFGWAYRKKDPTTR
ncbi:efflux RND transporter permease subunit [Mucilaginibacter sp.]|uniref:efflux RND transporter permease subunit n=1 Tax=Mucilaginibacter sp. TaxID=1882438 RepID=UPI000CB5C385|nr:CusA/CzcA family heavy metal efflux RND transporter [Mucilaginibacter sp.]PLW90912.1 MAG: CusA/CzcA family heavy metal efflux RND transporter [Mucilaginibacter sp.]PMP66511.1 MAG: CusA/CzcA family heavy metal efflux RND transporter [Mucilaginibacter sp.]HEK20517.1 efflux RND transporter permease subunit [Bacteroidota bacterium]